MYPCRRPKDVPLAHLADSTPPPKIHVLGLPAQVLLAAGVSVWSTDFQGRTALALAAEGGHGNASLLLKVTPLMVH